MKSVFKFNQCLITSLYLLSVCFSLGAAAQQTEQAFTTVYRYDLNGRVTGVIKPDPDSTGPLKYAAVRNTYSAGGSLTLVENGELSTWLNESYRPVDWNSYFTISSSRGYEYDNFGRKTKEWLKGNNGVIESLTQTSYNSEGLVQCKAVRMNKSVYSSLPASACDQSTLSPDGPDRITRYTYDALDQVTREERGVGTTLTQTYVTNTYSGRLLETQSDANGNKTALEYDTYGRLTHRYYPSITTPGTASTTDYNQYGYDVNNNINMERKRNGAVVDFQYDNNNRVIVKNYVDNTKQKDVYFDYDLRGLQLRSSFGTALTAERAEQKYDGFGNVIKDFVSVAGVSRAIYSKYDAHNNRVRVTHHDNNYFTYQFDGLDRLGVIYEGGGMRMLQIDYNPDGHRKHIYRRSGISSTIYSYTNGVQMDSFTQDFPSTAHDLTNTFQYNPAHQISQLSQSNSLYYYSGNENRTGAYLPDRLNRYTSIAGQPLGYDTNSNLTNDGTLTYQYDDENRLISTGGTVASSFVYDPRGRLFQSIVNGTKTHFLYDGDALALEYDGTTGVMQRRYIHGDRVDEPLVQYNSNVFGIGAWRYLHADHQGSIIAHSDVNGAVLSTAAYDSYGIPRSDNIDRFGYTGQIWFKELGLFYYKARVYHPKLGRFLQTDPIGYMDQMNLYAYVGNDPVNKIDPTGMYGRGSGWTDDQWKRFDKVQQKAAGRMEKTASNMESKAAKLDAKGKPGGDALRAKAGSLNAGAAALRSNGADGKIANAVTKEVYGSMPGHTEGGAASVKNNGPIMTVNIGNTAAWGRKAGESSERAAGHESLHTAGLNDQVGANGARAYFDGRPEQVKAFEDMKGTPQADINPDHLMDEVY